MIFGNQTFNLTSALVTGFSCEATALSIAVLPLYTTDGLNLLILAGFTGFAGFLSSLFNVAEFSLASKVTLVGKTLKHLGTLGALGA